LRSSSETIRAVVVDDSPTARELIVALLNNEEGIQVVGTGNTGEDAVRLVKRLKPNILAMDVCMPEMDGVEATRNIMRECPVPIVLMTSTMMSEDVNLTFRAMKAGALTVAKKPGLADPDTCSTLIQTIRLMAGLPVVHHWGRQSNIDRTPVPTRVSGVDLIKIASQLRLVGIASSTGGPGALANILGVLPENFPWPILIVQHVTVGFGQGLAEWLNTQTRLRVSLAGHGDTPTAGQVLLAPDDYHLQLNAKGLVELIKGTPYKGLRPSANYLFSSLAEVYGVKALGIILTGMGNDGADGMEAMYKAGGWTIAQNEESSIVYGMPREAVERGVVRQVLPPDGISAVLMSLAQQKNGEKLGDR
jgi:two-component system, chemotaxis family, protein-glutamate methylesterase/glutaminase